MRKTRTPNKLPGLSVLAVILIVSLAAMAVLVCLFDLLTPRDPAPGGGDPAFRQYIIQYMR